MTENGHSAIAAIRDDYRTRKTALLAQLQDDGGSTRGLRGLLQGLSEAADAALLPLWQRAGLPAGVALVAVEGCGRGDPLPPSDVDVLVLTPDGISAGDDPELKRRIEDFIGSCWDAGLEIGSAVRTVEECVAVAAGDVTVQTSLL